MNEEKSAYRGIMKSTALFGGLQLFQILISLIRSKAVAIILGPAGMGVISLFQSLIQLFIGISNFGLSTSAVNYISNEKVDPNNFNLAKIIKVFKYLILLSAFLGATMTLLLSNNLSQVTFGSKNYTNSISILSLAVLINLLSTGRLTQFRAFRETKTIVRALFYGNLLGLTLTIPMYYYFGQNGIVPSLILVEFSTLLFVLIFRFKLTLPRVDISFRDFTKLSTEMLSLGLIISLSGIFTLSFNYALRIFISNLGTVSEVGIYSAGFALVNTYFGLIFTAMATDFYPNLVSLSGNHDEQYNLINQQSVIGIIVVSTLVVPMILFIKWLIYLFYSEEFLSMNLMIVFASAGMIFKAFGWAFAYLFLARSRTKIYFWSEFIFNIYTLLLNILGYYFYGLNGIGISYFVSYVLYALQVYYLSRVIFDLKLIYPLVYIFTVNFIAIVLALSLSLIVSQGVLYYIISFSLVLLLIFYNLFWINRLLDLRLSFFQKSRSLF